MLTQAEEQRLQTEYLEFQEEEAARHRKLQVQITTREDRAKKEVKKTLRRRERAAKKKVVSQYLFVCYFE